MSQRIIITVAKDGATEVRTEGFAGNGCIKASQFIERALGTKSTEQLTSEYFQSSVSQSPQVTQGNKQ